MKVMQNRAQHIANEPLPMNQQLTQAMKADHKDQPQLSD